MQRLSDGALSLMGATTVKNHFIADGKPLQANKSWGQLKRNQQEWILRIAHDQYDLFMEKHGKVPVEGKKQLIEEIYAIIQDREIWIPFGEVYRVLSTRIALWNRRHETLRQSAGATVIPRNEENDSASR